MQLECYRQTPSAAEMIPAGQDRDWMDATSNRYAYRCLPLTMANTVGWTFPCPTGFEAAWNGGPLKEDVQLFYDDPKAYPFASGHFGSGILTLHTGWLFRTPPDVQMLVQGAPNHIKDGIQALTGLVETEWLPFHFTMNWRFTRPGRIRFDKGEPFCFVTLIRAAELAEVQPIEMDLADNAELNAEYQAYSKSRGEFNKGLRERDPEITKAGWQRNYTLGRTATGQPAPDSHASKRRMKSMLPKVRSTASTPQKADA